MSLEDFGSEATSTGGSRSPTPMRADDQPYVEPKEGDLTQWAICPDNRFMASPATTKKLPPGAYGFVATQIGIQIVTKRLQTDELLELPDSRQSEVLDEIKSFWEREPNFKAHNVLHRRGFIFYGPAGGGKTCLVQQVAARVIAGGDIVCIMDTSPTLFRNGLHLIRGIEPKRRIVCVFEDLDAIIAQFGEDEILSLLDGENQIDHVLNLATTNYPERLDRRLVGRPRRFDHTIRVDMPTKAMRKLYFVKKLKLPKEELDKWVAATKGFSFAACCELLISVRCLGNDFDKSIARLTKMNTTKPSSTEEASARAGFGAAVTQEEE